MTNWRSFSLIIFLVFAVSGAIYSANSVYNRPKPVMDYVPQEIGIYDSMYWELKESDCRSCHGNSLVDRHHATPTVLFDRKCIPCHEIIPERPGVLVINDCLTAGCHSWGDIYTNGWHHNTDLSDTDNCVACHDPNLIEEITPIRDFEMYPPSVVTPTPFSCENCHWDQEASVTGDPENPGHPSTYDHNNMWGQPIGFHEYGKPIYGNLDTHHMAFQGNVGNECIKCHSSDPNNPDWTPSNPQLIRYCEICHSIGTLHTIGPHVEDTVGWKEVGFHVEGNTDPTDLSPAVYKTFNPTGPFTPESTTGIYADEQCFGCHADLIENQPAPPPCNPAINNEILGMQPRHGTCGTIVTLRGECFGEEHYPGYMVQMRLAGEQGWITAPIHSWTDTLIEIQIPCLNVGNYDVRVTTPTNNSNQVVFTLKDWESANNISPTSGPCGTWITISGPGRFGDSQSSMLDEYNGVHHVVDFVATQGTYSAINYRNWSNGSIDVELKNLFVDKIDPNTELRNFVKDDGSGSCEIEDTIRLCDELNLGTYSVYVKSIYFGDEDGSGDLTCGDTIFQVAISDPVFFELNANMQIYRIRPTRINVGKRLKIYGINFGPTQENGRICVSATCGGIGIPLIVNQWSNTRLKANIPTDLTPGTYFLNIDKNGDVSNCQEIRILH